MKENILKLLMELFAIIGKSSDGRSSTRRQMEAEFLRQTLSREKADEFLKLYDDFVRAYHGQDGSKQREERASDICTELNQAITQKQKAVVILRLIEYVFVAGEGDKDEVDFLRKVHNALRINDDEYDLMLALVTDPPNFTGSHALRVVPSEENIQTAANSLVRPGLEGEVLFAYVPSAEMYFMRSLSASEMELSGTVVREGEVYIFGPGAAVRSLAFESIYYSDVVNCFLDEQKRHSIEYRAEAITYHFASGKQGLHPLSFQEHSGSLVGIMGGSGAGKSTLLSVLNGTSEPTMGKVSINGLDLHQQSEELEGVVGFVSQSDLLMEDLTVFQNLYFNAQLCLAHLDDDSIRERVDEVLKDLGLYEARGLKVGSPLDKIISGGQRKRLNIALELIREPGVLFLDEPTSGLSSRDSEIIIDLLKSLALKGKLIFVVIHQPSSQIFKVFDRLLLLDQGGYPIYQGNPVDAIIYFKHATHQINPDIGECVCCGNVNPEQIFNIVEARLLDDNGLPTGERRFSPEQWNDHYLEQQTTELPDPEPHSERLEQDYHKPGLFSQFAVFVKRDVLSKLHNKQYMLITLLEAPVLAFILTFLTRYQEPGSDYTFYGNRNLVAYVFMSVIVALFLGLMVSAEEIFRDRKIRKREQFLNLSWGAYLSSKMLILLVISAIQTLSFVLIGNMIMGFKELYIEYWLMLFAVAVYANTLGLNISSAFKSAVTIYVLIPFLIIPQLLLSGLLVKFDELNPLMASRSVVPMSGEVMATRWALEGLMVETYTSNSYEQHFFELEKRREQLVFNRVFWFKEMDRLIQSYNNAPSDSVLTLIRRELTAKGVSGEEAARDAVLNGSTSETLHRLRSDFGDELSTVEKSIDKVFASAPDSVDRSDYWKGIREAHFNERIEALVCNSDVITGRIFEENGRLHSGQNAIYFDPPEGQVLRAHFYAPRKWVFGRYVDTYWVNLAVILSMAAILYMLLYFKILARVMDSLSAIKLSSKGK